MPSLQNTSRRLLTPQLIIGLSAILLGLTLSLDRMGVVAAGQILRLWPAILIAIGVQNYFDPRRQSGRLNGVIWMSVGGLLLLNTLGVARVQVWTLFWPMVLILIGTHLVLRALRRNSEAPAVDLSEHVNMIAILSGVKSTSSAGRFRGGEFSAFMGAGTLDLRQATIPPGERGVIDLFMVMAGFELFVPPHWDVSTPVAAVMGGIEDKRLAPLHSANPPVAGVAAPMLVLDGFLMMGGIEIKS